LEEEASSRFWSTGAVSWTHDCAENKMRLELTADTRQQKSMSEVSQKQALRAERTAYMREHGA